MGREKWVRVATDARDGMRHGNVVTIDGEETNLYILSEEAILYADSRIRELEEVEKRFHAHDCASAINDVKYELTIAKVENTRLREAVAHVRDCCCNFMCSKAEELLRKAGMEE